MPAVVIFEDEHIRNLYPLTLNRPVFDLRCGIRHLWQKVTSVYPQAEPGFYVRDFLTGIVSEYKRTNLINKGFSESVLFVNGRVLWDEGLARQIPVEGEEELFFFGAELVAARLKGEHVELFNPLPKLNLNSFYHLPARSVSAVCLNYFWDVVNNNSLEIKKDYQALGCNGSREGKVYEGVHLINAQEITIAAGASVKPGVIIDAEQGPVLIDSGATLYPNSVIEGPCYIGRDSQIKISARIYKGTTIGEVCKVGGEVNESIIHSYSNKQHDGYLGHAYLGQWINIGAETNNSDLKNDYGEVTCIVNDEIVATGSQFVGMAMGDFSRTAINTMFNTGTVVGIGCNIFGVGFPPKYVPSFTWGGAEAMVEYRLDKCLDTVRRMMRRRNLEMTVEEEKLFEKLYLITDPDREKARMMNRM
jgi:UDP-N-acetylglucosamine diphosphorylase/glucosamine-1-phosphate N-acetyltransferase